MEWERAKNIILVAFVLLNLGLAGLLFLENSRYTMTQERVRTINAVLSENNIVLYTHLMRRFPPMRHLDIAGFDYDVPALVGMFFDDPANAVQEEMPDGHYRFRYGESRLDILNGVVSFNSFDNYPVLGDNVYEISHAQAVLLSDGFIVRHYPDFVRDIVFDEYDGSGVRIIYRQQYRGRLIYSNSIEFLVSSRGIEWVDMHFGRVLGHSTETRRIFAPDEILLTFMQRMRGDNPIFINDIDMVYMKGYWSDTPGAVYPAVPVYRIFVRDSDFPIKINAFTNVIFE